MKHFFTMLIAASLASPAMAEYTDNFVGSFEDHGISYQIISEENKTAALSGIYQETVIPENYTIPSTVVYDNGETQTTYTVVQINSESFQDVPVKNLTIPATVQVVGPKAFLRLASIETLTIDAAETPLEYHMAFFYDVPVDNSFHAPLKTINLNRSVKTVATNDSWAEQKFQTFIGTNAQLTEVNIGVDVAEIGTGLFKDATVDRVNIADWNKWISTVKFGDVTSVPYYMGGAEVYGNGLHIANIELREGMESTPDYVMAGLPYSGELTLPSSLKKIGAYSFYNNRELYWVSFPEGLETIGNNAFDGCEILEFDNLPTSLRTIGDYAFKDCQTLASVTLPEEMETLGNGAFYNDIRLQKAVLFSNVKELGAETFMKCAELTNVYLPKELTAIGEFCFAQTPKLETLVFPQTLETIGDAAFFALKEPDGEGYFKGHDVDEYIKTIDENYNWLSYEGKGLTEVALPASLKSVGRLAFAGCPFIVADLGTGVETIADYAFYDCRNMKDIKFAEALKTIGKCAFAINTTQVWWPNYTNTLAKVNLPASVTTIGKNAFLNRIGEINIPDGVTTLESGSVGYPGILNIGSGVKTIADGAFYVSEGSSDNKAPLNLRLIRIKAQTPPSVAAAFPFSATDYDKITLVVNNGSKDAYSRNPRWRNFTIVEESESDKTIHVTGESPITEEIRLQSGVMPSRLSKMTVTGVLAESDFRLIRENMISLYSLNLAGISNTSIPADAFKGMTLLTEIVLPDGVTYIGDNAFNGCSLMNMPVLPSSLQTIGSNAFNGCSMLTVSEIPAGVTAIGERAFAGCSSLRDVTIASPLKDLANETFSGCSLLENIDMSASAIEMVGSKAFENCQNLAFATLSPTLTAIGEGAFASSGLTEIELPATVARIGDKAFSGTKLRTVTVPEGVTEIADQTFADCSKLVAANFPQSLTSIFTEVFNNSLSLSAISCRAIDAPQASTGAFSGVRAAHCSLTVPSQSFRSYLNAPQWGMFAELVNRLTVEIPEDIDVTAIDEEEYQDIMEEEALEEEANAPVENEEEPQAMRRRARAAALAAGGNYSSLFNGATLGTASAQGTRIFINLKPGDEVTSVKYNGKEMISEMTDGSLLLPGSANGSLIIAGKSSGSSVDEIEADAINGDTVCAIYDLTGRMVYNGRRADASLPAGIYIIKANGQNHKVAIR